MLVNQVLGQPGRDNALLVRVETGQSITRLLFDCGDNCLNAVPFSDIQSIDHLLFSHLHMDHIGGFDAFFRCTFNRDTKPNVIWGPPGTARIIHHRFQGFWWNLHSEQPGTWRVNVVYNEHVEQYRFEIAEAFEQCHHEGCFEFQRVILETDDFFVLAIQLEHNGPCLGYLVQEKPRQNVQMDRVAAKGLKPGPWLQHLKQPQQDARTIEIEGQTYDLAVLKSELLTETPGDSTAYLTDFLLDKATSSMLQDVLSGCTTVVCEAQYRADDLELAQRNYHTTTAQVSQLAANAGIGKLILFHLSDRYDAATWSEMLRECQAIFPNSQFPDHWDL